MNPQDSTATRPEPVGRREQRAGGPSVVLERTFRAPATDVWAALTEPERLVRWIGTWSGDPASGTVQFRMTAEGEDIEAEAVTVHECDPPRRLVLSWVAAGPAGALWEVEVDLAEAGRCHHPDLRPADPRHRDRARRRPRLGVLPRPAGGVAGGGDVAAIAWADYEPMMDHYEALFADLG